MGIRRGRPFRLRQAYGGRAEALRAKAGRPARPSEQADLKVGLYIHCTFAVTLAFAFSVNVHVRLLLPLLEQAPDQIASRPFDTLSVIDVPVAKDADPVLPTATLIPAGLDVTRSPLRPVAVTVSVAWLGGGGGGGGEPPDAVTRSDVAANVPLNLATRFTEVLADTGNVVTEKFTRSDPAGTATLAGIVATAVSPLWSVTTAPPDEAVPLRTTVPVDGVPPGTSSGSRKKWSTRVAPGVAFTSNCRVSVASPSAAESVTSVSVATACVWTPTPALLLPSVKVTFGCGIDTTDG